MQPTPNPGPNDALLVSVAQVAAMLALSVVTVRRLVRDRILPSVKIGTAVRIPMTAVQALASPRAPAAEDVARDDHMTDAPQRDDGDGRDGVS